MIFKFILNNYVYVLSGISEIYNYTCDENEDDFILLHMQNTIAAIIQR